MLIDHIDANTVFNQKIKAGFNTRGKIEINGLPRKMISPSSSNCFIDFLSSFSNEIRDIIIPVFLRILYISF